MAATSMAADRLAHLGILLDPAANNTAAPDTDISAAAAPARTLVIAARKDVIIARETRRALT